jgi:hypothetical protein
MWTSCREVMDWRGYSGDATFITEEMMCRTGVVTRGIKDQGYREFDQVVHEMSHTLNYQFFKDSNIDNSAGALTWGSNKGEWFPCNMQKWFNSDALPSTRANLPSAEKTYLATFFNDANTWVPPRRLRNFDVKLRNRFIISGTLLTVNDTIFSPCDGSYYLKLQGDGNLVVSAKKDNGFKWGSFNNMGAVMANVKSVMYLDGELIFCNTVDKGAVFAAIERRKTGGATPEILFAKRIHDVGKLSCRLVVNNEPGSFIRVIDWDDSVLWSSN